MTAQQTTDHSVELTHTFNAPRDRVFAAWTESDQIMQWFGPATCQVTKATVDLRVGGEYRFVVNPGDGSKVEIFGEFKEVVPPQKLVYTWSFEPTREDPVTDSLVTVEFNERGDWTDLVLRHEALPSEKEKQEHTKGWNGCIENLDKHLAG
ncbi:MAG: SRPBCC domain-containing protein [Phycisphaerae bacterium]|jgi:uncharacterized protein YndB with AHSA1/START domain